MNIFIVILVYIVNNYNILKIIMLIVMLKLNLMMKYNYKILINKLNLIIMINIFKVYVNLIINILNK